MRLYAARLAVVLLTLLAAAPGACDGGGTERITVTVAGLTIDAEVVRSAADRTQGLGGRESLAPDEGMLFVFDEERVVSFWMRGMRFPLDFVWIASDGTVADLTAGVPPPEPGTEDPALQLYQPSVPVRYVLEVNSGVLRQGGVQIGGAVTFEPEP